MASKKILIFTLSVLMLLAAGWALDIWRGLSDRETQPAPTPAALTVSLPGEPRAVSDPELEKRHIRWQDGQLFIYAGPVDGNGELLRALDISINVLPPRWLALLTNGGIEFADEETLLMALDNLDELIK